MSVVHQGSLLAHLRAIFPDGETHINSRKHLSLTYPETGGSMEFDFFIPSLNLCFEFQDPHHYTSTWYFHETYDMIHGRDNIKKHTARTLQMTLIAIPCWWPGDKESLIATIWFERPDLFVGPPPYSPISFNPAASFFKSREVPDVGELMLASFPVDPYFKATIPSNSWWIGEKYDGIRCCWNAKKSGVYARTGKILELLPSISAALPKLFLDCEIWFGRGNFSSTYSLFAGSYDFVNWHSLRIVSFDIAAPELQKETFEKRYTHLLLAISLSSPFNVNAPRILCKNHDHLNEMVGEIIEKGGEGVILRRVGSLYESGRSSSLVKLKTTQGDKEGIVVEITEENGVVLKLGNGETFEVPPEDILIPTPSVGEIVSFSFESHARRDLPVSPKIYRIRTDVSWEDISWNSVPESKPLNDSSYIAYTAKPMGHWTMKNMRKILEEFAKKHKKDPLLPSTWYTTSRNALKQFKGGRAVLGKFKGGYFQTVKSLFPEIGLDAVAYYKHLWRDPNQRRKFLENATESGFDIHNPATFSGLFSQFRKSIARALVDIGLDKLKDSKENAKKRRRFFEAYAAKYGFDPLVRENWYSQPKEKIMSEIGAKRVMVHYAGDVAAALLELFPNIGLERYKLKVSWRSAENRRRFFETYAKEKQFDPRNPHSWYLQSREDIMAMKGASGVLEYHEGSVAKALIDLFPDIGLDISNFTKVPCDIDARKRFFQNYANARGFSYMLPDNWYTQTSSQILSFKGAHRVLGYHNNSFSQALIELFPNIEFDKAKFRTKYGTFSTEERRRHFENYAKENEFDPRNPKNWYSQNKIHLVKHSTRVLNHYDLNPVRALMDLFPDIGLEKAKFRWT